MSFYTTIGKSVFCQELNQTVQLTGKYRFIGESSKVCFSGAVCSVVQNSVKHSYEQEENIKYIKCPLKGSCEHLSNFETGIDLKRYGLQ